MRDLHTHTIYSDGKGTPEQTVRAAVAKGFTEIGISDHSYTSFDESYCMKKERVAEYKAEIAALKEKYRDEITVLCGVEQDAYSPESTAGYDYAIGSVHFLKKGEEYYALDNSEKEFRLLCDRWFGGDYYALAEEYFALVAAYAERQEISVIGHFDLIAKFNEGEILFCETHPRYLAAAKKAADKLIAAGKIFEINTGAMLRGYRSVPYPTPAILAYLREKGAKLILSSDAHSPDGIGYAFENFESLI